MEQLLHGLGGDSFLTLINQTLEEVMLADGFSQVFIDNVVTPLSRFAFGQTADLTALVGKFHGAITCLIGVLISDLTAIWFNYSSLGHD